jgi:hypothetical protein
MMVTRRQSRKLPGVELRWPDYGLVDHWVSECLVSEAPPTRQLLLIPMNEALRLNRNNWKKTYRPFPQVDLSRHRSRLHLRLMPRMTREQKRTKQTRLHLRLPDLVELTVDLLPLNQPTLQHLHLPVERSLPLSPLVEMKWKKATMLHHHHRDLPSHPLSLRALWVAHPPLRPIGDQVKCSRGHRWISPQSHLHHRQSKGK